MLGYKGLILPDEFLKRKIIRNDEFYLVLSVKHTSKLLHTYIGLERRKYECGIPLMLFVLKQSW